ncbi:MAG TPA: SDR family oxidoreductase [Caulobacteraceae bacterium]|jgi:NAD(P)-dependent dehydrogenase (short-subunit alcohol dehydrogenase family)|nr:SDR family oxidoreductase [Caulobacteraceae bacterium]
MPAERERGWALVTGAARRVGRELALTAARCGYDVVVHYRSLEGDAAETIRLIEALGRRALGVSADLGEDHARLVGAAPGPLTLLVNCASLFEDDRIDTLSADTWDAAASANLRAPILLAQAFAAALPADRRGLIVNIIDQRVLRPTPQFFSYAVSKAALWAATPMMAQGLAPRIRVNAIAPGPTLPSIHQSQADFDAEAEAVILGHGATPAEIGQALAYLIDAPSVTGQMIAVDGGQHLSWRTPDIADS